MKVVRREPFYPVDGVDRGRVEACELPSGEFITWDVDEGAVRYHSSWLVATSTAWSIAKRKKMGDKTATEAWIKRNSL